MKKLFIIVTIVLLTICLTGISVFAKAQQDSFYNDGHGIDKTILGSGGKVIINIPEGNTGMVVQGMLRNLDPNANYYVYLRAADVDDWYEGDEAELSQWGSGEYYYRFDLITTNEEGHVNFHINIDADDLRAGTSPSLQVFIDEELGSWITVLISDAIQVNIP